VVIISVSCLVVAIYKVITSQIVTVLGESDNRFQYVWFAHEKRDSPQYAG